MGAAAFPGPSARASPIGAGWAARSRAGDTEARLTALARAHAPLRRVLARLAGRLVAIRGWERLGFVRLADFARERLGLSGRQLQDLAHVDAALARLPRVEAAFLAGTLSWSKTRLLCRVAVSGDEARWVALARRLSVRALEREVRAVDRGSLEAGALADDDDGASAEPRETIQVRCSGDVHGKWWRTQQLARRVAGEKLARWECMEAVVAELLSALPAIASAAPVDPAPTNTPPAVGARLRSAPAAHVCAGQGPEEDSFSSPPCLPVFLEPLVQDLADADPFELDVRLRRAVAIEQRLWSEAGALLARARTEGRHRAAGFPSFECWARERFGLSPRKTRALLRLERAGDLCAALRDAYRDGRLSWVQAHALVPLLVADEAASGREWTAGWIAHAERVSVRRLEDDVDQALALGTLRPPEDSGERQTCARPMEAEAQDRARAESHRFFFTAPREDARWFRALLCSLRRRLERATGRLPSEGEAVGAMLAHAIAAWMALIPQDARWRREHAVFTRDGWRCTAPGCSSYRNLHDHHVVFRSRGGSDALSNRTTLCAAHHLRGVHAGVMRCTGSAPGELVFELGLRADAPPLAAFRSGDVRLAPAPPC